MDADIQLLKNAAKAYRLADEYDNCPLLGEDGHNPELDFWAGMSIYDVTQYIIRKIEKM
jgi:hypothetical protein